MNRFALCSHAELDMLKKALFSLRNVDLHVAQGVNKATDERFFQRLVEEARLASAMIQEINRDPRIREERRASLEVDDSM